MTSLILASASQARATMLRDAGIPFEAVPADIDEEAIKDAARAAGRAPEAIAADLAIAKARTIAAARPEALILGSDQVLIHRDRLLSKPHDLDAARTQLRDLRGDTHRLVSAAALVRGNDVVWHQAQTVTLTIRPFSDRFLDDYLARIGDLALTSVGCYHLEGLGAQLFVSVDGDYFTVLGLPLLAVLAALRDQGVLPE